MPLPLRKFATGFAAFGIALLFIASAFQKIWGLDTWWQMAAGRWILANGFPTHDVLSYSAADHPWIEVRWIFCVLLHWGWQLGGPTLLVISQTVALASVWALCLWPARKMLGSPMVLSILALGIASGLSRWVLRPEMVSYLFIPLYLLTLERGAPAAGTAGTTQRRCLWLLPLMQVVWTNSHTLFAIGPVFVWIWAVADIGQRLGRSRGWLGPARTEPRFDGHLLAVALFTTAACWLNPYGHAGAMFPILLFTQIQAGHIVSTTIGEMASPITMPWDQWTLDVRLSPVLLLCVLGTFWMNRRGLSLPRLLVLLATAYLASKAQRNVALLSIVGVASGARNLADWASTSGVVAKPRDWGTAGRLCLGAVSALLGWFVATDRWAVSIGAPREFGSGVVWWNTPRDATAFVVEKGIQGPIFNAIRDGGYIAWATQNEQAEGVKIFSDGRLEVYGPEFLTALSNLSPATWPAMEAQWKWNAAIVPVRGLSELIAYLHTSTAWSLVYLDHRDAIFVRREGPNAALASQPLDLTKPLDPATTEEDLPAWKEALGGVAHPSHSEGRVEALLALQAYDNAEREARAGLASFPENSTLREVLAFLSYRAGRQKEALDLLSGLDEAARVRTMRDAARTLASEGDLAGGIRPLEDALAITPADPELLLVWADLCLRTGQPAKAKQGYERFLHVSRASPNELNKLGAACEQLQDFPGAAAAYRKSLAMADNQPQMWNQLGIVLGTLGDLPGAADAFAHAVKLKPDYAAARNNLEKVRGMMR